ncbi:hypothetical protein [Streptomyces pratensis]|uniref:hypothetical protein n=1 Tax=Streptomyces pratensis TaxID=1169025 RepID=UPI003018D356
MSVACRTPRRTLLTATAAGALLAALWFVPSANATVEGAGQDASAVVAGRAAPEEAGAADDASGARLADTGPGPETTPYLIGGTALLGLGAGFVAYSARRSAAHLAF